MFPWRMWAVTSGLLVVQPLHEPGIGAYMHEVKQKRLQHSC